MKKVLSIFISIILALQCFAVALPAYAATTTAELQARIDALPDASTVSQGEEPYRSEIISIYRELYAMALTEEAPPHTQHLRDVAAVVLTVGERCWALVPTGQPNDTSNIEGVTSQRIRDWFEVKSNEELLLLKEEMKSIFRAINELPYAQKPKSNIYGRLRNHVDGFFTPQDRLDSIIPTVEQINNMSDADLQWYYNNPYTVDPNEILKTWSWLCNPDTESRAQVANIDLTSLRAISERTFTLADRINAIPDANTFTYIRTNPAQLSSFFPEISELYSIIFQPDMDEALAGSISKLIDAGHYVLSSVDRGEYLPTVDEYNNHMTTSQKKALHDEVYDLYSTINALRITDPHPSAEAMERLHALRPILLNKQERIYVLPPKGKARDLSDADKALVADEVRYIYAWVDGIGEGEYPNITRLHETAPEVLPLQELIDHLPDVSALESGGLKYIKYINKEAIYLRELVGALGPEDTMPNTDKLDAVEAFFGLNNVTDIWNESDLLTLLNEMNTGTPKIRTGKIMDDFTIAGSPSLSQGTLTLMVEEEHKIDFTGSFSISNAKLNLGTVSSDVPFIWETVSNNLGKFSVSGETASLNLYSGFEMTGAASASGIATQGNAVVNLFGCRIHDMACGYHAPINMGGTSTLNIYDGTVIEDCSGNASGAIGSLSDGTFGFPVGAFTVNMFGGTIRNCSTNDYGGGAVCFTRTTAATFNMFDGTITNCTASNASRYKYGGAIFMLNNNKLNLTGGEITGCTASNGGVVFAQSLGLCTIGGNVKIYDNEATAGGGGVLYCTSNSGLTISGDAEIYDNSCASNGGAFYVTGTVNVGGNAYIHDNTAASYGAGIYSSSGTINIGGNARICENNAASIGGGVYMTAGTLNIKDNALIYKNNGGARGGAVYTSTAVTTISGNAKLTENVADNGAGMFMLNAGTININGGEISKNVASTSSGLGGGIYANKGTINMTNGAIYSNQVLNGGGIGVSGGSFTMTGGAIYNNTARYGAGVYLGSTSSVGTLNSGIIAQNMSSISNGMGGGVYNSGSLTVADGFKLYDNYARNRGDDIQSLSTATALTIGEACTEQLLGCHNVDGWYEDSSSNKWSCYIGLAVEPDASIPPGDFESGSEHSLKAAHGPSRIACKDANGRILNQLTTGETISTISRNGAVTIHRDFEQKNPDWYIGSDYDIPAGTKLTLIYYPNGTEATGAEYYHYTTADDTDLIPLADFKQMGTGTAFARSESNAHFICQLCIVFPDSNALDSIKIWMADSEYANYTPNISAVSINFDSNATPTPSGNIALSDEQGGEDTLTATATVSDLGNIGRVAYDPEQMLGTALSDYTEVLTVELLNSAGKRIAFPSGSTLSINDSNISVAAGIGTLPITTDGDYEIEIAGLNKGKYKVRASICAASDAATDHPMGMVVNADTSGTITISPAEYAISASLSGGDVARVFTKPTSDKELTFSVGYIPAASAATDISVVSYVKSGGGYTATAAPWAVSISGASGSATATVTVPQDTAAGTYRLAFKIGTATKNYNIIITND